MTDIRQSASFYALMVAVNMAIILFVIAVGTFFTPSANTNAAVRLRAQPWLRENGALAGTFWLDAGRRTRR